MRKYCWTISFGLDNDKHDLDNSRDPSDTPMVISLDHLLSPLSGPGSDTIGDYENIDGSRNVVSEPSTVVTDGTQPPTVDGPYAPTLGPTVLDDTSDDYGLPLALQTGSNLRCSRNDVGSTPSASAVGVLPSSGPCRSVIAHDRAKRSASIGIRMLSLLFTYGVLFSAARASGAPLCFVY